MITQEMIDEHHVMITELMKKAPDGKWKTEPVRFEFKHAGLDCLGIRQMHGAWCGYVGVPDGHPLFGKEIDDVVDRLDVHGGVTYADACRDIVCHFADNEDEKRWWFGFDCMHSWDYSPTVGAMPGGGSARSYKDMDYVRLELEKLAYQLRGRA